MSLATLPSSISLRIVPRPAVRVAGVKIRTDATKADADAKKLWGELAPSIKACSKRKLATAYGITWIVDPKTCSIDYCAAIKPGKDARLPEDFEETQLPAGLYAECTLASRDDLYRLYDYIYNEWLPLQDGDVSIDNSPCYEVYSDDYTKEGHMKLYIPVVGA